MIKQDTTGVKKAPQIYQKIANNIREARSTKGVTQEKLAFDAGLNRAYIGYIERGERKPSVETLEKITKALRIKVKDLFDF